MKPLSNWIPPLVFMAMACLFSGCDGEQGNADLSSEEELDPTTKGPAPKRKGSVSKSSTEVSKDDKRTLLAGQRLQPEQLDQAAYAKSKRTFKERLARKVSFEFNDTPLEEALTFLNALLKVGLILDPAIAAKGFRGKRISLRVNDLPAGKALEQLLKQAGLVFEIRPPLFITTRKQQEGRIELQILDASDLIAASVVTVNEKGDRDKSLEVGLKRIFADAFELPGTSIDQRAGRLIIMQDPLVHGRIERLLKDLRKELEE